ncbi:MAG: hypothetical protein R2680_01820 [Nitrososphaeraceae archaeon]
MRTRTLTAKSLSLTAPKEALKLLFIGDDGEVTHYNVLCCIKS